MISYVSILGFRDEMMKIARPLSPEEQVIVKQKGVKGLFAETSGAPQAPLPAPMATSQNNLRQWSDQRMAAPNPTMSGDIRAMRQHGMVTTSASGGHTGMIQSSVAPASGGTVAATGTAKRAVSGVRPTPPPIPRHIANESAMRAVRQNAVKSGVIPKALVPGGFTKSVSRVARAVV